MENCIGTRSSPAPLLATSVRLIPTGPPRLLIGDDASVKAAVIREVGASPEVGTAPEPVGEAIDVLAAPINPIDLAVSRGLLASGHPELPYVPGCEAVGRTGDGRIVWVFGGSLGRRRDGALAERAAVAEAHAVLQHPAFGEAPFELREAGDGIRGLIETLGDGLRELRVDSVPGHGTRISLEVPAR